MKSETFHEDFARHEEVTLPSDRRFGFVAAGFLIFLGCLPAVVGGRPRIWALVGAAAFAVTALVSPMFLGPVHRLMQRLGRLMHTLMSPVVLAVLFFAVITPFGLLMRRLGHDPLRRQFESGLETYWIKRPLGGPAPESMRNQF